MSKKRIQSAEVKGRAGEHPAIDVLRSLLRGMRNDAQGGYEDVGPDGKYEGHARFASVSIGYAAPAQLDALFDLAGIRPDPIVPNGTCAECVSGAPLKGGAAGDLGWSEPCCSCARPKMKNFVPLAAVRDSALHLTAAEAIYLQNAREDRWWADGIATSKEPRERQKQLTRCLDIEGRMRRRGLVDVSGTRRQITNKGARALDLRGKKGRAA